MGAYPQTDAALAVRSLARGIPIVVPAKQVSVAGTPGADGSVAPEPVGEPSDSVTPPPEKPEDREAREREFKLWQDRRAAEHRRTRQFAFGVIQQPEKE
jgi:hypothetical protein